jgi:hypothetical protein
MICVDKNIHHLDCSCYSVHEILRVKFPCGLATMNKVDHTPPLP